MEAFAGADVHVAVEAGTGRLFDALDRQFATLEQQLRQLARLAGLSGVEGHDGIGELTACTILGELGDLSRLSASRESVRCAGIDIGSIAPTPLPSRHADQAGSPQLRWALYESARGLPSDQSDRADYLALEARGLSHPRVAGDRQKTATALLPHPARARPRRPGASRLSLPPIGSAMPTFPRWPTSLPTSSRGSRDTRPRTAVTG